MDSVHAVRSQLDASLQARLDADTAFIRRVMQRTAVDMYAVGQRLQYWREHLDHGQYRAWLDAESLSVPFAWCCVRLVETVPDPQMLHGVTFAQRALRALMSPSYPDEARQTVLDQAADGVHVTEALVHEARRPIASLPTEEAAPRRPIASLPREDMTSPRRPLALLPIEQAVPEPRWQLPNGMDAPRQPIAALPPEAGATTVTLTVPAGVRADALTRLLQHLGRLHTRGMLPPSLVPFESIFDAYQED